MAELPGAPPRSSPNSDLIKNNSDKTLAHIIHITHIIPPYPLAGLIILTYYSLGVRVTTVEIIAKHLCFLFPGIRYNNVIAQTHQIFQEFPENFIYDQYNPDFVWLDISNLTSFSTILRKNDSGSSSHFRDSLFYVINSGLNFSFLKDYQIRKSMLAL